MVSVALTTRLTVVQFGNVQITPVVGDYDGDAKATMLLSFGAWYVLGSTQVLRRAVWIASDIPVAGDYDGDGKTDIAVYREGIWYLLRSQQGSHPRSLV